ncbi:unnamed protein product, partial [Discosporangium mesarthrocarpum]
GLKRADFYTRVVDKAERPNLKTEWPQQLQDLLRQCWADNEDERLSFREISAIL